MHVCVRACVRVCVCVCVYILHIQARTSSLNSRFLHVKDRDLNDLAFYEDCVRHCVRFAQCSRNSFEIVKIMSLVDTPGFYPKGR